MQSVTSHSPLLYISVMHRRRLLTCRAGRVVPCVGANHGGDQGDESREFGVRDVNVNCTPDFQKIPLRIHPDTPIQVKSSFSGS